MKFRTEEGIERKRGRLRGRWACVCTQCGKGFDGKFKYKYFRRRNIGRVEFPGFFCSDSCFAAAYPYEVKKEVR